MLTKMRNKMRMPWGQAHNSKTAKLPKLLSPADLTRSSWAKPIKSCADVPNIYKEFFDSLLVEGQAFPYTVLTPSYERFIHKTTEKLISDFGHDIYILERSGNTFETHCYPVDGISYIEFRTVLLDSSITICGATSHGVHATSRLKFNSVTDPYFTPILKRIRFATADFKDTIHVKEIEKFNYLFQLNYKFMNYGKRSLVGGEQVLHIFQQPEIQERILTFMGKTYYKTISPTHMSILTNRELILIREEETRNREDRYGGVWDYIQLSKIISLSLSEKDDKLLVLTIQLPENACFEFLYQASAKEEINQLLERFRELTTE